MKGYSVLFDYGFRIEGFFEDFMHTFALGVYEEMWDLLQTRSDVDRIIPTELLDTANKRCVVFPFTANQGSKRLLASKLPRKASDRLSSCWCLLFLFR